MKNIFARFFVLYILLVAMFCVAKIGFMLIYWHTYAAYSAAEWWAVCRHGLCLDISVAGYLCIVPGLLLIAEQWFKLHVTTWMWRVYFIVVAFALAAIYLGDAVLYGFWGFRLDSTPFFYMKSPQVMFACAPWWQFVVGAIAIALVTWGLYRLFIRIMVIDPKRARAIKYRKTKSIVMFVLTAAMFIPIRGGFSVSVMNVGHAYFSTDMALNHAAINPCFSLLESLSHDSDFGSKYRFMPAEDAAKIFATLSDTSTAESPNEVELLNTTRPNIIFCILESFMVDAIEQGAAPCLAKIANEGLNFTNFYASSFRTDRGLVAVIDGYPSQPTTSIMKYPRKTESLPSIPVALAREGYDLTYYFGGYIDFTNRRSFLRACGYERIVCVHDFPDAPKFKWGVHDEYVFNRLKEDLQSDNKPSPYLCMLQTSSSHEPFDVPCERRFEDNYLNSVAYTDSCIGSFVDWLRSTPAWDNTLLVFVADHAMRWPSERTNYDIERYHIPFILSGGALAHHGTESRIASQTDIAATLLAQLGIDHSEFRFSKNIYAPSSPRFAYFSAPDLFGFIGESGAVVYDNASGETARIEGDTASLVIRGKAFLQTIYDDIAAR